MGGYVIKSASTPLGRSLFKSGFRLAIIVGIAFGAHFLIQWIETRTAALPDGTQNAVLGGLLVVVVVAYAALMALPFVPGIEIGVSLMMIRGPEVAPVVYLATVTGLTTAYLAGRFMSYDWLYRVFMDLRLRRACAFLERSKDLDRDERLNFLRSRLPSWLGGIALNFRYVTLALLLNLPGNAIIGGGGGICLMAGLSRLFAPWIMVLTIALAVSPVPILVWVLGIEILGSK